MADFKIWILGSYKYNIEHNNNKMEHNMYN